MHNLVIFLNIDILKEGSNSNLVWSKCPSNWNFGLRMLVLVLNLTTLQYRGISLGKKIE
jgi:hypothetical protein